MARKRKSTLGPFPKTLRWREIVERFLAPRDSIRVSDKLLNELRSSYEELALDQSAIKSMIFLVALPVCSRFDNPLIALFDYYGIELKEEPNLQSLSGALDRFVPEDTPAKIACKRTIEVWLGQFKSGKRLFDPGTWAPWRLVDGSAFCDIGREFFTQLNRIYFAKSLRVSGPEVDVFAEEMSLITRTFSARWFNACVRKQIPDMGSIRWYLAHCLGKLDLELSRELSDWIEEPRVWRSRQPRLLDLAS